MKRQAVIGGQFGDEGKGLMTDYLASQAAPTETFVVRYNGGQQAGHTVTNDQGQHVFSNFGSGSFRNIPTYWSQYCSVDPLGIVNEINLLDGNFGLRPVLMLDLEASVTTPFDKYQNQNTPMYLRNGTCGVGVGATFQREEDFYSLKVRDLYYEDIFNYKLEAIEKYYGHKIKKEEVELFKRCCTYIVNADHIIPSEISVLAGRNLIFEGAQGLMLDQHFGYFPHVTRSNTGSKNILEIIDQLPSQRSVRPYPIDEIYLMTRGYQTRHGKGPMTNQEHSLNVVEAEEETNERNAYQGKFRQSVLDIDQLRYGYQRDGLPGTKLSLVVTCLDRMRAPYKFTYKGELHMYETRKTFIQAIQDATGFESVYVSYGPTATDIKPFK